VAALTAALADLDGGRLPAWRSAPVLAPAREYWRLPASALGPLFAGEAPW